MNRYLRTLRLFWSASLAAEMEYRSNFVFAAMSSLASLAGTLFVLWSLMRSGYTMNGWPFDRALVVVGVYTVLDGITQTLLSPNRQQVSELVRDGTLDFILLKPMDSQFWLSTRKLSVWGLPNIVLGFALIVFAGLRLEPAATVADFALLLPPLFVGLAILYALGYLLSTLTIWFTKLYNITIAMQALLEAGRYPIPAYPTAHRIFFTFILPVAFMTTVPAQALMGEAAWTALGAAIATAAVLFILSRLFWRYALRYYTSASS